MYFGSSPLSVETKMRRAFRELAKTWRKAREKARATCSGRAGQCARRDARRRTRFINRERRRARRAQSAPDRRPRSARPQRLGRHATESAPHPSRHSFGGDRAATSRLSVREACECRSGESLGGPESPGADEDSGDGTDTRGARDRAGVEVDHRRRGAEQTASGPAGFRPDVLYFSLTANFSS
ncbi:hypothetical protein EVAR_17761_1 [Eumeta japonica]|uniref:Uncharacterized protein n=1 Tax=Eumeta variegata TaxID=151549 RepID=A0A4C1TTF8_EUMVA|nr:hypothetical protein EVAR_17761_1 [Eumeta japonica]